MFRLRLPKVLRELESACREAADQSWTSFESQRAQDMALALANACKLEGLRDPALVARSLACLLELPREQILAIEHAFREKIDELLASLKGSAERVLTGSG
jgi:hypothetical protein